MSKINLKDNTWYITAGDYLVHITRDDCDSFCASLETSPGDSISGRSARDVYSSHTHGWYYNNDGTIEGLKPEWCEKLKIVAECTRQISLPEGYEWLGGYPKLYIGKDVKGQYIIRDNGRVEKNEVNCFFNSHVFGPKRIGLIKVDKPVESPVPAPIVESKEEEMKKETAIKIAGVAGSLGFRALNYWLFEPAVNTFRPVVKGVRYAVFLGMITSSIYGYRNPEVVKNAIMSCLPKVSIEAPEILK